MIYCVDVEGNLLEFVVYFLDGRQLTDGDDHCTVWPWISARMLCSLLAGVTSTWVTVTGRVVMQVTVVRMVT